MIEIKPRRNLNTTVTVPGSKSYTNRALLIAALAKGRSHLHNPLQSDDTRFMIEALNQLGINATTQPDGSFVVDGCGGRIPATSANLYIGNAGTAARFLTAMLTLGNGRYIVDGCERMRERPIQHLLDGLAQLGADAVSERGTGCPPVVIQANGLNGGNAAIPGHISSQFFSALLLAAPYAKRDVSITSIGELISRPYVDMTLGIMRDFGVEASRRGGIMNVKAGQHYRSRDYTIECDASGASYFFAAAAVTGGTVRVTGLSRASAQGDVHFVDALEAMGCTVNEGKDDDGTPYIEVTGGKLTGIDIDMGDISDVSLTLAAVAVFADGPTTIRNVANMRLKETDRISALVTELRSIGQEVDEHPDGLTISPRPVTAAQIETYDDHRMAMSFAVIGLGAAGIVIKNPECVSKTFPEFFEIFNRL